MDEQTDWRMTDEEFETFNRIAANAARYEDEMNSWPDCGEMMPWYVVQAIQNLEKRMGYAMAKEIETIKRDVRILNTRTLGMF